MGYIVKATQHVIIAPMKLNFWAQLAISEAINIAEVFLMHSGISDAQKAALMEFIAAGQKLLGAF